MHLAVGDEKGRKKKGLKRVQGQPWVIRGGKKEKGGRRFTGQADRWSRKKTGGGLSSALGRGNVQKKRKSAAVMRSVRAGRGAGGILWKSTV